MATAKSKKASAPAVDPVAGAPGEVLPPLPDDAYPADAVELGVVPVSAYRITSRREGFRRAGRAWSKSPADVPAGDLTAEQLAALLAEPLLKVEAL